MSIGPDFYVPAMKVITGIIFGEQTVILTFGNHNYANGLIVNILIPYSRGCQQLNGFQGPITVLAPASFLIDVNSTNFDAYKTLIPANPKFHKEVGQVIPVGEGALTLQFAVTNNNNIVPEIYPPPLYPAIP